MLTSPSKVLRFDAFTLDLARSTLRRGEEELPLRRQSFDVLRYLAEHAGKVVSRDELIAAVWAAPPARPEDSLFQCIKDIRRALGDDARWIVQAVPGRGYQLMAEVVAVAAVAADGTTTGARNRGNTAFRRRQTAGAATGAGQPDGDAGRNSDGAGLCAAASQAAHERACVAWNCDRSPAYRIAGDPSARQV